MAGCRTSAELIRLITHCFFCAHPLPHNKRLEHFALGERIAFDPARGRLWAICNRCGGWSLAPIEERWEALEELERLARNRGKLLIQGENIALFEVEKVQVIRVGRAGRAEESWWRYGRELSRRRERARRTAQRGKIVDALVAMAVIGLPIWAFSDGESWINAARARAFGKYAWSDPANCSRCGRPLKPMRFTEAAQIRILRAPEVTLGLPCVQCQSLGGGELSGRAALNTLLRVLAYDNFAGATEAEVRNATQAIQDAGSARRLIVGTAEESPRLATLPRASAFALEIALNEAHERGLLELELRELDAEWQKAEQIAAIVDDELTFRLRRT
jgi:hypothetical protein